MAPMLSLHTRRFALACVLLGALSGCGTADPKNPGIDVGGAGITWADKNLEQRFSFMAGRVEPLMKQLFVHYDKSYEDFSCATCHGGEAEFVDYKMPADIYPIPEDDTIKGCREYDEDATAFMEKEVMPASRNLFNRGDGREMKVTCFTCHPKE